MTPDIIGFWANMSTGDMYLLIFCIFVVMFMIWMELLH